MDTTLAMQHWTPAAETARHAACESMQGVGRVEPQFPAKRAEYLGRTESPGNFVPR